jgi:hypothetical protein
MELELEALVTVALPPAQVTPSLALTDYQQLLTQPG